MKNKYVNIAEERIKDARLKKFRFLDLSYLQLDDFPEDISDMQFLLEIDISNNKIREFPNCFSSLTNLQVLNISNNLFQDLFFVEGIHYSLRELNISNNLFNHIPRELFFLNTELLLFDDNPFMKEVPWEIASSDNLGYIDFYFNELRNKDNRKRLFEAKLLIVGKGEVGKTSLMKTITDSNYRFKIGHESSTHGININISTRPIIFPAKTPFYSRFDDFQNLHFREIISEFEPIDSDEDGFLVVPKDSTIYKHISEFGLDDESLFELRFDDQPYLIDGNIYFEKEVDINIWDFGGQEILYSTHQFFLTQRSIYLLVWEPRSDNEIESLEYWLKIIERLSNNSPVIIVMNKSDIRIKQIDEEYYKQKFGNIVSFLKVSCLTKNGIRNLNIEIDNVISTLPHIGDILPKTWDKVRNNLKQISKDYLTFDEFRNICSSSDNQQISYISRYLNDLGVIIHFQHDFHLRNLVVINPGWLTKAIYLLIHSIKIQNNNGLFSTENLNALFDDSSYPEEKFQDILLLMEKFEICFKIIGSLNLYIIPTLLQQHPKNKEYVNEFINYDSLKYEIEYDFIPTGIIERLICRLNNYINETNFWKNGVILSTENSEALIISDSSKRKLKIYVKGDIRTPLYNIVVHHIKEINIDIKLTDKDFSELLACNCPECQFVSSPYMFKKSTLLKFIEKGKRNIACQVSTENVNIQDVLIGYRTDVSPKNDLLLDFISASSTLQSRFNQIKDYNEDQINIYLQDLLKAYLSEKNYYTNEQTRKGNSKSGKNAGELDFAIETIHGETISFFEGFILNGLNKRTIIEHVEKTITRYDLNGLKEKFIGVYSKASDFQKFSEKYLILLNSMELQEIEIIETNDVSKVYLGLSEMRVYKTSYNRHKTKLFLYHILINLNF